ncbi:extracellular solute-binding protein [Candidatus Parcubacteria bacterium]|nr:extracellular solute-binding protein [Candidatus Parcubacteria bacterium]
MSKFQIILLAVFGIAILAAVLIFSLFRGSSNGSVSVTIWGSLPQSDFSAFISNAAINDKTLTVNYVEKSGSTFDHDFTEALALGKGPDIILIPESLLWTEREKLLLIPYQSVSQKDFSSTFVQEGELFLSSGGIYALPLYMDPLVLYSNRDMLDSAAIAQPIKYWDEIYSYISKLTKKDNAGNIAQATLALGETKNIPHSKDILSLLMLQAGTSITKIQSDGSLIPTLTNSLNSPTNPASSALDFYTQFSNQAKDFYTWNRSLLSAQTNFISGDSAFYIGFGSEFKELKAKNPNLNIGLSPVPQSRASGREVTMARIYGLAITRGSKNPNGALTAVLTLVSHDKGKILSEVLSLPPARRDLLSQRPDNGYLAVLFDAAIQSRGWLDPEPTKSALILNSMIEAVNSGRSGTEEAVAKGNDDLDELTK